MSSGNRAERAARLSGRGRLLLLVLSVCLLQVGLVSYSRDLTPRRTPLPLAPLRVSPELQTAARVPAEPGALRGQNLVIVTLDTTRPDRLGCYGNREIQTPNLNRLAAGGVIFSNAIATAPTTLPSHASILTGLYPHRHGARSNALYRLGTGQQTLAEILSENGYDTAAFVSSFVLDARFGLDQGFGVYDDESNPPSGFMGSSERRADETTGRAVRWLGGERSGPFFLWVHYYDPHAPHQPPAPFAQRYDPLYDGEIAFVDQQLGRLLEAVATANARETFVVVAADHGEALGEHGEWAHGYLLQEATLRIPLILYAPRGLAGGAHVATRVSQVDLMPTILSALGIAVPEGLDGVDLLAPSRPGRALLAEAMEGHEHYGWAPLAAIYQGALKYVEGPQPELYDLARDPLERRDLFAARRGQAARLRQQLERERRPQAEQLAAVRADLTTDELERLERLGYLVAGSPAGSAAGRGPDPRQMLPGMIRIQELLSDFQRDRELPAWRRLVARFGGRSPLASADDLIRELEHLVAERPDFAPAHAYLAKLYAAQSRFDEAARAAQRRDVLARVVAYRR